MGEHKFFLFWDLRRGAITISWIQMIVSAFTIAGLISYFQNAFHFLEDNFTLDDNGESQYEKYQFYMNLSVTYEIIMLITTISLIFGIVKKYPLFYQPWLIVFLIENFIFVILFVSHNPIYYHSNIILVIAAIAGLIIIVIRMYIYISICQIYRIDVKYNNAVTYDKNIDLIYTKLEANEDA